MELILIDVGAWLIVVGFMIGFIAIGAYAITVLIDLFIGDKK